MRGRKRGTVMSLKTKKFPKFAGEYGVAL